MTTLAAMKHGVAQAGQRRGLVLALYLIDLGIALLLAVPIYTALQEVVGPSGYSADLARAFDEALWWEIFEEVGATFGAVLGRLFWVALVYVFWKALVRVGIVYALHQTGPFAFVRGLLRFGGPALGLMVLFVIPLVAGVIGVTVVAIVVQTALGGEIGIFWAWFVVLPALLITLVVILDLMQDYASISLVVEETNVWEAWKRGIAMPFRHGQTSYLYVAWFGLSLMVFLIPLLLDVFFPAHTASGIWARFVAQQAALLVRTGILVAWLGSQLVLFHHLYPALAESTTLEEEAAFSENGSSDLDTWAPT